MPPVPDTNPLFIADYTVLLTRLRMDGIADDDHVNSEFAIVEDAVRRVRIGFFDRLGATRIAELQAIAFNPNPVSDDDLQRMRADQAELLWIKKELIKELPVYFLDGSGRYRENWNEEGLLRQKDQEQLDAMALQICEELERVLTTLTGAGDNPSAIKCSTIGADEPVVVGRGIYHQK